MREKPADKRPCRETGGGAGVSGWREYRFSDVLIDGSISYGIVQPGTHTETDGIPIVRVNNVKNGTIDTADMLKVSSEIEQKYQRTRLEGGELLITVVGSIGECAIVPKALEGWNVARAISVARIKDEFDTRFIKYCFKLPDLQFQMYGNMNDTVQPTLNLGSLKCLTLNLPLLPEQKAITAVLSSLDDKIDLLHRQNQTLEAMAETLFRQWFIEAATPPSPRPSPSGRGSKKGARVEYSVADFVTHVRLNVNPAKTGDRLFHHYSIPAFDAGMRPVIEPGSAILSNKFRVTEDSILVSKLNPREPRVWPVGELPNENSICSTEFQVLKPKDAGLYGYIYNLLRSSQAADALIMAASGTSGSHQRVRPEDILNITTILPSLKLARQYSDIVMPGLHKMRENRRQIQTLEKLRDNLLPKLMSGEVRVEV